MSKPAPAWWRKGRKKSAEMAKKAERVVAKVETAAVAVGAKVAPPVAPILALAAGLSAKQRAQLVRALQDPDGARPSRQPGVRLERDGRGRLVFTHGATVHEVGTPGRMLRAVQTMLAAGVTRDQLRRVVTAFSDRGDASLAVRATALEEFAWALDELGKR